jgi:hypothetical protein
MNGQNVKVVDKFNNLGVETYIYIYISVTSNLKVQMLEKWYVKRRPCMELRCWD